MPRLMLVLSSTEVNPREFGRRADDFSQRLEERLHPAGGRPAALVAGTTVETTSPKSGRRSVTRRYFCDVDDVQPYRKILKETIEECALRRQITVYRRQPDRSNWKCIWPNHDADA